MSDVVLSIKAKRVVYRGVKCYEITDVSSYQEENLPIEYFMQYPYCINEEGALVIVTNDRHPVFQGGGCVVEVGDIFPEEALDKVVEVIRHCGKKLHDINERIKVLEMEWKGDTEFPI